MRVDRHQRSSVSNMCVALRAPKTRTRSIPSRDSVSSLREPLRSGLGSRSHVHVIVPSASRPSVPLKIACGRRAPTECHSRRRGRAHGPRGQHTFAEDGVRAATVRVEASRRSICCPYDALPASAPSVSTPPPGRIAAATTATTTIAIATPPPSPTAIPSSRVYRYRGRVPPLVLARLLVHPLARRLRNPPSSYPAARDPAVSSPLPLILPRFRCEAFSLRIRRRPSHALPPPSRSSLSVALSSFPIIFSSVFVPFNTVALTL